MSYVTSCIEFLYAEYREQEKEIKRIIALSELEQMEEEECVTRFTVLPTEKEFISKIVFPKQNTKIREDKSVVIYDLKSKHVVTECTVVDLKPIKGMGTLAGNLKPGAYFMISKMDFMPHSLANSLKKIEKEGTTSLMDRLIYREEHNLVGKNNKTETIIESVHNMYEDYLIVQGPPGTGKTYTASRIIESLLAKGKKIGITSHSHKAINNLCESISDKIDFKGFKITSDETKSVDHKKFQNGYTEVDFAVQDSDVIAGTCFAFCKMKSGKLDYLIVDEASQLKFSYLLAAMRFANNIIILGDQKQLQSFSIIEDLDKIGGESVLEYLIPSVDGEKALVSKGMGYFLDKTYRMQPGAIANTVSQTFYNGKLAAAQKKKLKDKASSYIGWIWNEHSSTEKSSQEECEDVLAIYKSLKRKRIKDEEIMIIAPYNAQAGMLREYIPSEQVKIGTVDILQGQEAKCVIISMTYGGDNKDNVEFVTDKHRLNVAISRAKEMVYIVASESLKKSKKSSAEFKSLLKSKEIVFGKVKDFLPKSK